MTLLFKFESYRTAAFKNPLQQPTDTLPQACTLKHNFGKHQTPNAGTMSMKCPSSHWRYQQAAADENHVQATHPDILLFHH